MIYINIDQRMSDTHRSIMDSMEWVVTSLWDNFSWGINFWPRIETELDPKNQSVCSFSLIL